MAGLWGGGGCGPAEGLDEGCAGKRRTQADSLDVGCVKIHTVDRLYARLGCESVALSLLRASHWL